MFNESLDPRPISSFLAPVPVPAAESAEAPCVCVSFSSEWLPYVLGALNQLVLPSTWRTDDPLVLAETQHQAELLIARFALVNDCTPKPPTPPGMTDDQIACNVAGYLINTVVKESLQLAIDYSLGISPKIALIAGLLDTIPGVGDFVGLLGTGIQTLEAALVTSAATTWAAGKITDALWDQFGCALYNVLRTHDQWDSATWSLAGRIISELDNTFPEITQLVADALQKFAPDLLNGLAAVSNMVDYDCSHCGDETPRLDPPDEPILLPQSLEVTDGTLDFKGVKELTFVGAITTGTIDDVTVTIPEVAGPPGPAGPTGPEGLTGPAGPTGATGPMGPAPTGGTPTILGSLHTAAKALTLWTGSANTAPPPNWYTTGFDDSAWSTSVVPATLGQTMPTSAEPVWHAGGTTTGERILLRQHVTIPSGAIISAILTVQRDDGVLGIWVNGVQIPTGAADYLGLDSDGSTTRQWVLTLDPATYGLVAGGANLIAIEATNTVPTQAWVAFSLTVNLAGLTGATGPAGPTGPTGPTGPAGDSVGPGTATSAALGAETGLTANVWTTLLDELPAAGTYDVSGIVTFYNGSGSTAAVAVAVLVAGGVHGVAESFVPTLSGQSVSTPHVVVTLDGSQHLLLRAYASVAGTYAEPHLTATTDSPATMLTWSEPGIGPAGPTGPTGASGTGGSLQLLQSFSGGAASVTITCPAGYKGLRIIGSIDVAAGENIAMQANGDTTLTHYANESALGAGGGAQGIANNVEADYVMVAQPVPWNTRFTMELPNYLDTVGYKTAIVQSTQRWATGASLQIWHTAWEWQNTAALTSLLIKTISGHTMLTGTHIDVYGYL